MQHCFLSGWQPHGPSYRNWPTIIINVLFEQHQHLTHGVGQGQTLKYKQHLAGKAIASSSYSDGLTATELDMLKPPQGQYEQHGRGRGFNILPLAQAPRTPNMITLITLSSSRCCSRQLPAATDQIATAVPGL
jgi:hypothetical protein